MKSNNDQLQPYLSNPHRAIQAVKDENVPTIDMLLQQMQTNLMSDNVDINKKIEVFDLCKNLMLPASHSYLKFFQAMLLPWLETVIQPPEDLTQEDIWEAFFGVKLPISETNIKKCKQLLECYKSVITKMGNDLLPYEAFQEHKQPSMFNLISKNIPTRSSTAFTEAQQSTFLNNVSQKNKDILKTVTPLNNYVRNKLLNFLDRPEWIQLRQPATETLNKVLALLYTGDTHLIRQVTDCLCQLMDQETTQSVQIGSLDVNTFIMKFADSMYLLADPQIDYEFRTKLVPILWENLHSKNKPSELLRRRYLDSLNLYYALSPVKNDQIWRIMPLGQPKALEKKAIYDKNQKKRILINEAKQKVWSRETEWNTIHTFKNKIMGITSQQNIQDVEPVIIAVPSGSNNTIKTDNQNNTWANQNRLTFNPGSFNGVIDRLNSLQQANVKQAIPQPYFGQPNPPQNPPVIIVRSPSDGTHLAQNTMLPPVYPTVASQNSRAVPTFVANTVQPQRPMAPKQESHVFFSQSSEDAPPKQQVSPRNQSYVFENGEQPCITTPVKKQSRYPTNNVTPMRQGTRHSVATTQTNRYDQDSSTSGIQPGKTVDKPQFKIAQVYNNWNKMRKVPDVQHNGLDGLVTQQRWYDSLCCRPKIEKMYEIPPQDVIPLNNQPLKEPVTPHTLNNIAMSESRFTKISHNGHIFNTSHGRGQNPSTNLLEFTKNQNQLLKSRLSIMKNSQQDQVYINSPINLYSTQPLKESAAALYQPKLQNLSLGAKKRRFKNKQVLLKNDDLQIGFVWRKQNFDGQPYEPGNMTLALYFTSTYQLYLSFAILSDNLIYSPRNEQAFDLFPGKQEKKNIDFKGIFGPSFRKPTLNLKYNEKSLNLQLPYTVLRLFHYQLVDNPIDFIDRFVNPAPQHSIMMTPWMDYNKRLITQPNLMAEIVPQATLFTNEEAYFAYCQNNYGTLRYGSIMLMKMCRRVLILVEFQMKRVRVWLLAEGSQPDMELLHRVLDEIGTILSE